MKTINSIVIAVTLALPVAAQEQSAADIRAEALIGFGAALPEIEIYPDSMLPGAWAWMNDVEDGKAASHGATEQEIAEAAAIAGNVRNWSAVLYGTGADLDAYK